MAGGRLGPRRRVWRRWRRVLCLGLFAPFAMAAEPGPEAPTGLFIPHAGGVVPSVRLKAFRRGQQDVEYLTLLSDAYKQPHYAVAGGVGRAVGLTGRVHKTSETDAGTIRFDRADPVALWALRTGAGRMVSAKRPPYRRCVRPMPSPPRDMARLPDIGYVRVAPKLPASRPE